MQKKHPLLLQLLLQTQRVPLYQALLLLLLLLLLLGPLTGRSCAGDWQTHAAT
jgi:hypothetical protein